MSGFMKFILPLGLLAATTQAGAQAPAPRRTATLPARPAAETPRPPQHGHPVLHRHADLVVHDDYGRQRVIPACAAYGLGRGDLGPAPQMGANQPAPGAGGLPPAPGLSPVPGLSPAPGNRSTPGHGSPSPITSRSGAASGSTLQPLHSGWRTAGTSYLPGICYVRDTHGQLHLISL